MKKTKDDTQVVVQDVRIVDAPPLALDTTQAARAISVSPRTLWSLTSPRGPIKAKKVGRLNLYPISELQRFLNEPSDVAITGLERH